jgi:hypothetical protein
MEYKAIAASNVFALDEAVNKLIAQGWKPIGGVSIAMVTDGKPSEKYLYAQAMIRQNPGPRPVSIKRFAGGEWQAEEEG